MNKWIAGFLFLFLMSCSGSDVPSGILPKNKMEEVIWDMIQADQYYREYVLKDSLKSDIHQARYNLYEQVFQMHKVSRSTFDKSFEYYSNHPKLMKDVFDSLSAKGNRKLQDFYKPAIPVDTSAPHRLKTRLDSLKAQ